jgi:hypothetical protein
MCRALGGGNAYRVLVAKPKERDHVEDLHIDGKIETSVVPCIGATLPFCRTFDIIKTEN